MAEAWPERDQKSVGAAGLGQMVCRLLTLPGYKSVFLKEILLSISIYRVFKKRGPLDLFSGVNIFFYFG